MTRFVVLAARVLALWFESSASIVRASHTFQQGGGINYLYPNLEAPAGSGRISYSLCGDAQNQAPPEWRTGVENWDNPLSRWEFDEAAACSTSVHTQLAWEPVENYCVDPPPPFEASSCWEARITDAHGLHQDMRTGQPRILFDRSARTCLAFRRRGGS